MQNTEKILRNHAKAVDLEGTKFIEGAFNFKFNDKTGDLEISAYLPDCHEYFRTNSINNFVNKFRIESNSIRQYGFEKGVKKNALEISFKILKSGALVEISEPKLVDIKLKKIYTNTEYLDLVKSDTTTASFLQLVKKSFNREIGEFKNESDYKDVILAPFEYLVKHAFAKYAKEKQLPLIQRNNIKVEKDGVETNFYTFKPAHVNGLFNLTSILSSLYKDNYVFNVLKNAQGNFQATVTDIIRDPHLNILSVNNFIKGCGLQNRIVHTELNTNEAKEQFYQSEIFRDFSSLDNNKAKYNFLLNQNEEYLNDNIKDITRVIFLVPQSKDNSSLDLNKLKISIKNLLKEKPDFAIKIFNSVIESIPDVNLVSYNRKIKFEEDGSFRTKSSLRLHAEEHNLEIRCKDLDLNSSPNDLIYYFIQKFNNSNISLDDTYRVTVSKKPQEYRTLKSNLNVPSEKIVQLDDPYKLAAKRIGHIYPKFFEHKEFINFIIGYSKENNKSSRDVVLTIAKSLGYEVNEGLKIKEKSCSFILNFNANNMTKREESLICSVAKFDKYDQGKFNENLNSVYEDLLEKIVNLQERKVRLDEAAANYNRITNQNNNGLSGDYFIR